MEITIREHEYSETNDRDIKETGGMYSRCIHCGETIGQGWYGTSNSNCIERENRKIIQRYLDFNNLSILNWEATGDQVFCFRRYSSDSFTKDEIVKRIKQ